jgi:hypothetical protein
MTTMPPKPEVRASYTPAALDRASENLAQRSTMYRFFRAYYQWSLRGSYAQRVLLVATGFLAGKFPALRPVLLPIMYAQAFFMVLSWLGAPLLDVFLCLDGEARRAIPPWRRKGAFLTATALLTAIGIAGWAYATEEPRVLVAALCALAIVFPVSAIYRLPAGGPRIMQSLGVILFAGCAAGAFLLWDDPAAKVLAAACVIGSVLSLRLTVKAIANNPLNRR